MLAPQTLVRGLPIVALMALGACSPLDSELIPELRALEMTIDSSAPEELAALTLEITFESGSSVERCIEPELEFFRDSVGVELSLELSSEGDFDPCFEGEASREVTFVNASMTNAELLSLCDGEGWLPLLAMHPDDDSSYNLDPDLSFVPTCI